MTACWACPSASLAGGGGRSWSARGRGTSMPAGSWASVHHGVGGIMVLYENCLQRPNWQPEHAFTIVLKSAMNLTCKNQGFYYDTRGRIKLWSFRSASNIIILFTYSSSESPERIGSYYTSLERYFQGEHNAVGIMRNGSELTEKFRKSVLRIWTLGENEVWTPNQAFWKLVRQRAVTLDVTEDSRTRGMKISIGI